MKIKVVILYTALVMVLTLALFGRNNRNVRKQTIIEEDNISG